MSDAKTTPTWGYSKDDAKVFELTDGEALPEGFYASPVSVPGSDAEKAYLADAEREGAPVPLVTVVEKRGKAGKPADAPATS